MEVSGGVPSAAGPRTNALLKFELASPGLKPDCERACFWALGAAVSASRLHKDWAWWAHIPLMWTHLDKTRKDRPLSRFQVDPLGLNYPSIFFSG
jgi:hypothetical protein